jgi:hypothetical protein
MGQLLDAPTAGNPVIDIPGQQHEPGECTRLYTQGHRIGDGSSCALLMIQEAQGWSMCDGLDPDVGVRVSKDRMILLARVILRCEAEREIAGRPLVEPTLPPACSARPARPATDQGIDHGR